MKDYFDPKDPAGWVVQNNHKLDNGRTHTSYWYGPEHGYGRTYGRLDHSTRVWPTKKAAKEAGARRNEKIIRARDAALEEINRADDRLESVLAGDRKDKDDIAFAIEAYRGYLLLEPVYGQGIARTLDHAVDASRSWWKISASVCGVRNLSTRSEHFNPDAPRACPKCKRKIKERSAA